MEIPNVETVLAVIRAYGKEFVRIHARADINVYIDVEEFRSNLTYIRFYMSYRSNFNGHLYKISRMHELKTAYCYYKTILDAMYEKLVEDDKRNKVIKEVWYTAMNPSYGINNPTRVNYKCYYEIRKVIFNNPATIVFWNDGSKTVVKCAEEDTFDPEKGLAMAYMKWKMGNGNQYHKVFKKWIPEEEAESESEEPISQFDRVKNLLFD